MPGYANGSRGRLVIGGLTVRSFPRHMDAHDNAARRIAAALLLGFAMAAVLAVAPRLKLTSGAPFAAADPWTSGDLMPPQELGARLSGPADSKPRVVCVGFKFLYESGHIPGSVFYGPGREAARMQDL